MKRVSFIRFTFLIIIYISILIGIYLNLKSIIGYLFVSSILAYLFYPAVVFMEKKLKFKRMIAIIVLFIFLLVGFFSVFLPAVFKIFSESQHLYMVLIQIDYKSKFISWYENLSDWMEKLIFSEKIRPYLNKDKIKEYLKKNNYFNRFSSSLAKNIKVISGRLFSSFIENFSEVLSSVLNFFLIPVFLFYFLLDYEKITLFFKSIFPVSWNRALAPYVQKSIFIFSSFFRGQIIIAIFIGIGMSLILFFNGIDFAFLIGPLAGLANMVPYLGVIVGLIPTALIIFIKFGFSWLAVIKLFFVLLGFGILQMIDGFFLSPKIIGEAVELHPIAVIIAIVAGAQIGGFWGMILSIPLLAIFKMLYFELFLLWINKWVEE